LTNSCGDVAPPCFCFAGVDPIHFLHASFAQDHGHDVQKCLSPFCVSLMALSYNNGNQYLSDHDFISHGFHADIDAYGNEKSRDATISQENQQREKCLTSIAEVFT